MTSTNKWSCTYCGPVTKCHRHSQPPEPNKLSNMVPGYNAPIEPVKENKMTLERADKLICGWSMLTGHSFTELELNSLVELISSDANPPWPSEEDRERLKVMGDTRSNNFSLSDPAVDFLIQKLSEAWGL